MVELLSQREVQQLQLVLGGREALAEEQEPFDAVPTSGQLLSDLRGRSKVSACGATSQQRRDEPRRS
jgi:hypothetical protein